VGSGVVFDGGNVGDNVGIVVKDSLGDIVGAPVASGASTFSGAVVGDLVAKQYSNSGSSSSSVGQL